MTRSLDDSDTVDSAMGRIVVVGAGMVGHRVCEEILRAAPDAAVTLVGEEPYEPYNRVLLSELVAGRTDLASLVLPSIPGLTTLFGHRVVDVDRERRHVLLDDDSRLGYDHLVLATGASARELPLAGLRVGDDAGGHRVAGVHLLRTVDDARAVLAGSVNARRVVVIGAGPIGLEVACGLRARGLDVTVMASRASVLDRDLDARVGAIAMTTLADLGVTVVPDAAVVGIEQHGGKVSGVALRGTPGGGAGPWAAGGTGGGAGPWAADRTGGGAGPWAADGTASAPARTVPTDMLVLATGSVPRTDLAIRAGLTTRRGIVVDDSLRTSDPAVSAVGDCAETADGVSGLVAPGWDQARQLAAHLVHGRPVAPTAVTGAAMRLKAVGLEVLTSGVRASTAGEHDRVVALDDAGARRYVEVVVRQGTLVGLTCVGAPDLAARLSTQLDRPGVVPPDPLQLLVGPPEDTHGSPTTMPAATTVCRCNGVTKGEIVKAWDHGACSVDDVVDATRATTGCGGCSALVCGLVDWLTEVDPPVPATSARDAQSTNARAAGV